MYIECEGSYGASLRGTNAILNIFHSYIQSRIPGECNYEKNLLKHNLYLQKHCTERLVGTLAYCADKIITFFIEDIPKENKNSSYIRN